MANTIVLNVENVHSDECGNPPDLTNQPGIYTSYFENLHGEQFVMQWDFKAKGGKLWGGELGWGKNVRIGLEGATPITLSQAEQGWLNACLTVIRQRQSVRDAKSP
jgi:hypothetical protein